MFIGREKEIASLENLYNKKKFGMSVIYGRRRIGKSTLITQFLQGKKAIFYTATKVGSERNFALFTRQVIAALDPELEDVAFSSLEMLFDYITRKLTDEKLIIAIDELPYWAEKDEAFLSVLQKYIDTKWLDKNLMLILCGSALSFMEKKVLSEKSPLFGRRDNQIRLEAFNYRDSALFVPDYSYEDKAICYGITGGVAKYLSMIDPALSLDENIKSLFFQKDGYLFDETRNLLIQEFTDITPVNNIIEQIANGENTINTIAGKMKENNTTVLYSLDRLIGVGLVEKKKCITEEKNKKKTQYVLKDSMFKFWYEFIPKAYSVIELGEGEIYYERVVRPLLHSFMGSVFEEMCRYYTLERGVRSEFDSFITNVGTWWGAETVTDDNGKKRNQSTDIDVVGISEIDKTAVIGECKFKNEKIDKGIYDTIQRRAALISGKYRVKTILLFSLAGYTDWVIENRGKDTKLITLEELYKQVQ
ncbi:MAG: ATP-binding protein [Lachnospiraceae bacterium]|nr:ATP-binding protein [Lachnospiraceae bacterium]